MSVRVRSCKQGSRGKTTLVAGLTTVEQATRWMAAYLAAKCSLRGWRRLANNGDRLVYSNRRGTVHEMWAEERV